MPKVSTRAADENVEEQGHPAIKEPMGFNCCTSKKEKWKFQFCVDYRKFNEVTRKDAYPLPRINDTLKTLAGSQSLTPLDLISGY